MSNIPKSPRHRLGLGSVAEDEMTRWEARCAFLEAVYRVEPETYWTLFPDEPGEASYNRYVERWGDNPGRMVAWWQERWHLHEIEPDVDPWLANVAVNTVRARLRYFIKGQTHFWPSAGRALSGPFWTPNPRKPSRHYGQIVGVRPEVLYWDPTSETRKEAQARLMAAVDAELERIEQEVGLGMTKTKTPAHFEWLARYQVGRESGLQIAESIQDDDLNRVQIVEYKARAVYKGIKSTAELIGLARRQE